MAAAQPTNRRGGEPGGRGRQRSRANPFKSTQLRQWGFICYLGGHIVSRRERTDRLRRASDGLARREPVPSRSVARRGTTFIGPSLPFILRPFPPPGPVTRVVELRCHPPEKRIRRYTSLPPKFPSPSLHFLSVPSSGRIRFLGGMGRISRLDIAF